MTAVLIVLGFSLAMNVIAVCHSKLIFKRQKQLLGQLHFVEELINGDDVLQTRIKELAKKEEEKKSGYNKEREGDEV